MMARKHSGEDSDPDLDLGRHADDLHIVTPRLSALNDVLTYVVPETEASIRLLVPSFLLDRFTTQVVLPCWLAEYRERGRLVARRIDGKPLDATVAVTDDRGYSLGRRPDGPGVQCRSLAADVETSARAAFETGWQDAEPIDLRIATYSTLVAAIDERVGPELASDIRTWLGPSPPRALTEPALDPIHAVLLLAARRATQFYHLSRWADTNGVASIATCSNRKQTLESAGLLETETVSSRRSGRPRQRLLLADDSLADAGIETLFRTAQSRLEAAES